MYSITINQPYLYPSSSRRRHRRYHDYHNSIHITCYCNNPTRYCACYYPSSSPTYRTPVIYNTTYRDPCGTCRRYTCRCGHRYRYRTDDWYVTVRTVYY